MIMIDTKNNSLEFNGSKAELLAELGALIRQFVKKGVIDEKDFNLIAESALLSDEELQERALQSLKDLLDKMILGHVSKEEDITVELKKEDITEELKKAMKKEWEK